MEDRVFPGQGVQWADDGCELFDIPTVIAGKTQERADVCDVFWEDGSLGWRQAVRDQVGGILLSRGVPGS